MRIRRFSAGQESKDGRKPAKARKSRTRRRAVTSLEYLVMLSFILLAVIITVQKLGLVTSGLMQSSANATAKTNGP